MSEAFPQSQRREWIGITSIFAGVTIFPFAFFTFFKQYQSALEFGRLLAENMPEAYELIVRPPYEGFILDNYRNPLVFLFPAVLSAFALWSGVRNVLGKLKPQACALVLLGTLALFALYLFYFPPRIMAHAVKPLFEAQPLN